VTDTTNPGSERPSRFSFDDPTGSVTAAMVAYTPSALPAHVWETVAPACIQLVRRAGGADKERAVKDLQILAKTAATLLERNRPVALEEMLSDGALRDLDSAEQQAGLAHATRINHRAMMRRLQTIHRELPWQPGRRAQTHKVPDNLPDVRDITADIDRLARSAAESSSGHAKAFMAVMAAFDLTAAAGKPRTEPAPTTWAAARRFAAEHDVHLTKAMLKSAATLRVLAQPAPVAELIALYKLTRRDLDLAAPTAQALPDSPDGHTARSLRGASQI